MFCHKNNNQTSIIKGLQIDEPRIFVPWDTSEKDVATHFQNYTLSCVTDSYYIINDVRLFENLICNIGLHFDNVLKRIEFFRNDYSDLHKSYNDFQIIFESKFGKPSKQSSDPTDFENCEWDIGNKIKIYHYVMDRFGLAEYLFIENGS
jgi:hypothetical protein